MKRSRRDIETLANKVLKDAATKLHQHGFALETPPVPIREICLVEDLSINLEFDLMHSGQKLAGMLDAPQKAIYVEAFDILGRQNFTVAHEFGHYRLHWLPKIAASQEMPTQFLDGMETFTRFFRCTPNDIAEEPDHSDFYLRVPGYKQEIEHEANNFAQYLLMPHDLIIRASEAVIGLPYFTARRVLAQQFEVSEIAMGFRLEGVSLRGLSARRAIEQGLETKFFMQLSALPREREETPAIAITPTSLLRTLVSQLDQDDLSEQNLEIDLSQFQGSELNLLDVKYVVDLALLSDHLISKARDCRLLWPPFSEHMRRHLRRYGLSQHLGIASDNEIPSRVSEDTITGNHILLALSKIDASTNIADLADCTSQGFSIWSQNSESLDDFVQLIGSIVSGMGEDILVNSGSSPDQGTGYISAQATSVVQNNVIIGYRVLIAMGDIGISLCERTQRSCGATVTSTMDAVKSYFGKQSLSELVREIVLAGDGQIQINSGDVSYLIGRDNQSYMTGLFPVPGLQVSVMLECSVTA